MAEHADISWRQRQDEMEDWYRQFIAGGSSQAEASLLFEYAPYADVLAKFDGRIADIGGGAGLAGGLLPAASEYVVVDPSDLWAGEEWRELALRLRGGASDPIFVKGVGEKLPFESASFDGVVSFWSFNHATDPYACVDEASRILRPDGKFLVVLEDMAPNWLDVARFARQELLERYLNRRQPYPLGWNQNGIADARSTVAHKLSGRRWPLQNDHVRIDDRLFLKKLRERFRLVDRNWRGGFLSYELRRR